MKKTGNKKVIPDGEVCYVKKKKKCPYFKAIRHSGFYCTRFKKREKLSPFYEYLYKTADRSDICMERDGNYRYDEKRKKRYNTHTIVIVSAFIPQEKHEEKKENNGQWSCSDPYSFYHKDCITARELRVLMYESYMKLISLEKYRGRYIYPDEVFFKIRLFDWFKNVIHPEFLKLQEG